MIENFEHFPEHPTRNQSQICRVCLTTNVKMFSLQKYEFHKKYQEITGLHISPDDKYPSFLCWECAHHLSNCHRFKTRAVLSHYLLSGLLETDLNITKQNVRKINRDKIGLVSKLKPWKSEPNYFNLELTEPQTNDRTHNVTPTNHQITIVENEDDNFLPEDDIKKENNVTPTNDQITIVENEDDIFLPEDDIKKENNVTPTNDQITIVENEDDNFLPEDDIKKENNVTPTNDQITIVENEDDIFLPEDDIKKENNVTPTNHQITIVENEYDIFLPEDDIKKENNVTPTNHQITIVENEYDIFLPEDDIKKENNVTPTNHQITIVENEDDIFLPEDDIKKENNVTPTNHQITIVENEDDNFLPADDMKKESVNVEEESSGDDNDDDRSDSSLDDDTPLISIKHSKLEQNKTSDNKPKVVISKTTKTTRTKQKTQIQSNVKGSATTEKKSVSKKNSIQYFDSTFDISDLTREEQISEIEKRKKTKKYMMSIFKCEKCCNGFSNENSFKIHMNRHSNQSGEHECAVCKLHFKTYIAMRRHLRTYHVRKYTCKHCDFATTRSGYAKIHEKFHKGTKYKCAKCSEEFIVNSTYQAHVRIKHPTDIVCELCGYSFVSLKGLDLHKKLKHRFVEDTRPEGDYSCEERGNTFVKQEALDTHLNVSPKHTGGAAKHHFNFDGTKYKCPHCPEEFVHKVTYRCHIRIKHPSDIVCELCGYSFYSYRGLDQHKKYKHSSDEPSQSEADCTCEQCELTFLNAKALETHLKVSPKHATHVDYKAKKERNKNENLLKRKAQNQIKNRKKPNPDRRKTKGPMQCEQTPAAPDDHSFRLFNCHICPKSFQTKYALALHLRIHTDKKKVSCNVCGKEYDPKNFKRHMLIHSVLKPFECEACGEFFKHSTERKMHFNHVHLKVSRPKKKRGARAAKQFDFYFENV